MKCAIDALFVLSDALSCLAASHGEEGGSRHVEGSGTFVTRSKVAFVII